MDEKEYQHEQMLHEYDSLRAETLQIYEQQMSLVFSATITAAGAFLATLIELQASLLSLPIVLAVLIGVCDKSIANYNRIFRIGSYIAVVHEQKGRTVEAFRRGLDQAAWHSRWRRAARDKELRGRFRWIGAEAPRAEALFLLLLGVGTWALALSSLKTYLLTDIVGIVTFSISSVLTLILFYFVYQLACVLKVSMEYEAAFRRILESEMSEN